MRFGVWSGLGWRCRRGLLGGPGLVLVAEVVVVEGLVGIVGFGLEVVGEGIAEVVVDIGTAAAGRTVVPAAEAAVVVGRCLEAAAAASAYVVANAVVGCTSSLAVPYTWHLAIWARLGFCRTSVVVGGILAADLEPLAVLVLAVFHFGMVVPARQ